MMERVRRLLKINPGEGRTAARYLAFMVVVWTGFAVGGTGVEALLFARVGPGALPYLYIALGLVTFLSMSGLSLILRRGEPRRFLLLVPALFAVVVLLMRALVETGADFVYPVLWLLMMVMWTVQGVAVWELASTLHDTRQAKRLFPLYGSGWILGSVVGGLATRPLAVWIHAENLLLVWAFSLVAAFFIARSVVASGQLQRITRSTLGPLEELRATLRLVRTSPLLRWMAASLTLFALLYFVLTLAFAEAATTQFPQADRLAAFLGLFIGVSNGIGFLTALFLANRLFARFGLAGMVLTLPLIYLAGFLGLAVTGIFGAVLLFRFLQVVWVNGVWASAWQGLFNVVPPERRHRVRTFMDGVPLQAGIVAAGVVLILAERVLAPSQVALVGLVAAALATVAMWRARAAYGDAVLEALRAGNPEVFLSEEEPFGGYRQDAAALSVVVEGASDPDLSIRRTAVEILAEALPPSASAVLADALRDPDSAVRISALGGVARLGEGSFRAGIVRLLGDPDPGVRRAAVEALRRCSPDGAPADEMKVLLTDPDPQVRARAAGTLVRISKAEEARKVLREMSSSRDAEDRAAAVAALGEIGEELEEVATRVTDRDATVRRAATTALRGFDPARVIEPLLEAMGDADAGVRDAAVATAVRLGPVLEGPLLESMATPSREAAALRALTRLPRRGDSAALHAYARGQLTRSLHYHDQWRRLDPNSDDRLALVSWSLKHRAVQHALNAIRATARDPLGVEVAVDNLTSGDPRQRANALETLESLGDPQVVRPLLPVWESSPVPSGDPSPVLRELQEDDDPWLRAGAALAEKKGDPAVETLSRLPVMERVLFLRKVRLFSELTPVDLKHVAESATEHLFLAGEVIAEQGEAGDEMHIVVAGEIRVVLATDGKASVLARRKPGECVGEMAIVSEEPRMASLVAEGDVRTLSIDRKRFHRILRERPEASLAVMRVLCERLREAHGPRAEDALV